MNVVWEDRWLLIVDKPAGLPTQAARGGPEDNLYDALRADRSYVALHHRLDTAVSGLVVFALDERANAALTDGFRTHTIERVYRAVGVGELAPGDHAWVRPVDGAPARTDAKVLGARAGLVALELRPRTGRRHQLRIHAALAGVPLAGDRAHGGIAGRHSPRLALHATHLRLRHPVTGDEVAVDSAWPEALGPLWARASGELPPAGRGPG